MHFQRVRIATRSNGQAVVAWEAGGSVNVATLVGDQIAQPTVISSAMHPSELHVSLGVSGDAAITWIGEPHNVPTSDPTFRRVYVAVRTGQSWGAPQQMPEATGSWAAGPHVAVDGSGRALLSWSAMAAGTDAWSEHLAVR